jgi:ABC-2 type transport system ATP-binding protein
VDHGKIIALGTPQELKHSIPGGFLIQVQLDGTSPEFVQGLERLEGVTEVRSGADGAVQVYADRGGSLILEVVNFATQSQVGIRDVRISEPSLENLFLHHTGRSLRE